MRKSGLGLRQRDGMRLCFLVILVLTVPELLRGGVDVWSRRDPPPQYGSDVLRLVQAPSAPGVIYAVSETAFYRSTDSGTSWALMYESESRQKPLSVAVSQTDPNILFISSETGDYPPTGNLFKTANGGRTVVPLQPDPAQSTAYQLVVLPGQPERLIAARSGVYVYPKSVFFSTDGGDSWTSSPLSNVAFQAFAVTGNGRILYGIGHEGYGSYFYRSTDSGASWERLNWPGSNGERVIVDPEDSRTVYGLDYSGILYKTEDSGTNWKRILGSHDLRVSDVDPVPGSPATLYASSWSGFYKSFDAGASWHRQGDGPGSIRDLLLLDPDSLLAGTTQGVYRSEDGGKTWTDSSSGIERFLWLVSLSVDRDKPGVAWAGTSGLRKTTDDGKTWSVLNDSIGYFALSRSDHRVMYSYRYLTFGVLAQTSLVLRKSTDEGRTWEDLPKTFWGSVSILVDPHSANVIYLSNTFNTVIPFGGRSDVTVRSRSTNGGSTWEQIQFWPLTFDPHTPGVFWSYEQFYGPLKKTTDSGATWTELGKVPSFPSSLVVDPSNTDVWYASSTSSGVFKSTDGGRNWMAIGLQEFFVTALAIDPFRPSTLLAAAQMTTKNPRTPLYSVFRSDDGGLTWQEFNQGIGNKPIDELAFGAEHTAFAWRFAYVGRPGGIYFTQLDDSMLFPHLEPAAGDQFTGLTIANIGGTEVSAQLHAYSTEGDAIAEPVDVKVGSGEQWSRLAGSLLGGADGHEGWLRMTQIPYAASAFFSLGSLDLSSLDTAEATTRGVQRFVFPEVRIPPAITRFHIANPGPGTAALSFQLRDASGQPAVAPVTRRVPENGVLVADLTDLLPQVSNLNDGMYVEVSSDVPVVPFEQLWKKGESVAGVNGQDAGAYLLYCPQYASGPEVRSSVSIVNLDGVAGRVTLRLIGDDGVQIGTTESLAIAPFGKVYLSDSGLFTGSAETRIGYLEIVSDRPQLTGSVVFGDPPGQRFASALPLQKAGARRLIYSHLVSSAEFFTGLAVVNAGPLTATVSIEVFDHNGERIATKTEKIASGKKISRLLTEYCPELSGTNLDSGYIKVTSDQEIFSFALFGACDLRFLAAIQGRKY